MHLARMVGGANILRHDARAMRWISEEDWGRFAREGTDAHRLGTGAGGWLERYGDWVLWSGMERDPLRFAPELASRFGFAPRGWLARKLARDAREQAPGRVVDGEDPGTLTVREWDVAYGVEPCGGYSAGLFLDQRLNRHWVLGLRPARTLNLFAYTGSFSVCAALGGGKTLSVDAAKRALARARENFALNAIDAADGHRFVAEDATKIVPRLARRGEVFDLIVLDPPTFGRSGGRVFRIADDLPELVSGCFALLAPGGTLLVACNYAEWTSGDLRALCEDALRGDAFRVAPGERPEEIPGGAISWRIARM